MRRRQNARRSPQEGGSRSANYTFFPACPPHVLLWGAALAAAVSLPLMGHGYLLLLDWVRGPRDRLPLGIWGLGRPGGPVPLGLSVISAERLLGAPVVSWLPVPVIIAGAVFSMASLVRGSPWAKAAAGTLYALNPLVFERLWAGQIAFLLGYAVLPLLLRALVLPDVGWRRLANATLWWVLATALSAHFFWIGLLVFAAAFAGGLIRVALKHIALIWLLFLATCAYVIVPALGRQISGTSELALRSYRTTGDPRFGLFGNVLGLYGFWRHEPRLPKSLLAGWPLILAAILVVVATGARALLRSADVPPLGRTLLLAGTFGYVFSLGDQGPTGPVFRLLYDHLPGFDVMREPGKFIAVVALAYAALFGYGVDSLLRVGLRPVARFSTGILALVMPIAYTPTILWGFAGHLHPSTYPASWFSADRAMGAGPGRLLVLPPHLYQAYPFTSHRSVGDATSGFFQRRAIVGDSAEIPGDATGSSVETRFIHYVAQLGPQVHDLGRLMAPLGVEFVMVVHGGDYPSYGWVRNQVDLQVVVDRPDLLLLRNRVPPLVGFSRGLTLERVRDWGSIVAASADRRFDNVVFQADALVPGPIELPPLPEPSAVTPMAGSLRAGSPVSIRVPPGTAGPLLISEPYQAGWSLGRRSATPGDGGAILIAGAPTTAATIRFTPWLPIRWAYLVSILSVMVLGGMRRWSEARRMSEK